MINWNIYQSKVTRQEQNPYLDYLIDPSFYAVNRFFVLLFKNSYRRTTYTGYVLPKVKMKDNNVMIDGQNFFDQPVKKDLGTYDNVQNCNRSRG